MTDGCAHARARLPGALVGFGDPVVDIMVRVSKAFLGSICAEEGGSMLVSQQEMGQLRSAALDHPDTEGGEAMRNGGSAANVARCLARLRAGGGAPVRFVGMVGADAAADDYEQELRRLGVEPQLLRSPAAEPTAACLCLVTPGGQRTMRTCLGAAAQLQDAAQLPAGWADGIGWLHCEGYGLHRPGIALAAMRAARSAGARVSLDLASFEVVQFCWAALRQALAEGLLHTVFANEEEAAALLKAAGPAGDSPGSAADARPDADGRPADPAGGGGGGSPPQDAAAAAGVGGASHSGASGGAGSSGATTANVDGSKTGSSAAERELLGDATVAAAQRWLLRHCQVAVVSLGPRGCVARSRDGAAAACTADRVGVEDSVGAGDSFSAGWLTGYLAGAPLAACAAAGCAAGTAAVQAVGGVPDGQAHADLQQHIAALLKSQTGLPA